MKKFDWKSILALVVQVLAAVIGGGVALVNGGKTGYNATLGEGFAFSDLFATIIPALIAVGVPVGINLLWKNAPPGAAKEGGEAISAIIAWFQDRTSSKAAYLALIETMDVQTLIVAQYLGNDQEIIAEFKTLSNKLHEKYLNYRFTLVDKVPDNPQPLPVNRW